MERDPLTVELEDLSGHLEWLQALAVSLVADRQTAEDLVQQPDRLRCRFGEFEHTVELSLAHAAGKLLTLVLPLERPR